MTKCKECENREIQKEKSHSFGHLIVTSLFGILACGFLLMGEINLTILCFVSHMWWNMTPRKRGG